MAATKQGVTQDTPLVPGDWAPECANCTYKWQALRAAVRLQEAQEMGQERIDALLDDNRRLRLALGHDRPFLAVVAVQDMGA